jgi:hypothetical protein
MCEIKTHDLRVGHRDWLLMVEDDNDYHRRFTILASTNPKRARYHVIEDFEFESISNLIESGLHSRLVSDHDKTSRLGSHRYQDDEDLGDSILGLLTREQFEEQEENGDPTDLHWAPTCCATITLYRVFVDKTGVRSTKEAASHFIGSYFMPEEAMTMLSIFTDQIKT